jgi:hypothetical protein
MRLLFHLGRLSFENRLRDFKETRPTKKRKSRTLKQPTEASRMELKERIYLRQAVDFFSLHLSPQHVLFIFPFLLSSMSF